MIYYVTHKPVQFGPYTLPEGNLVRGLAPGSYIPVAYRRSCRAALPVVWRCRVAIVAHHEVTALCEGPFWSVAER